MAGVKRGGAAKRGKGGAGAGRKLARPAGSKYGGPMLKLLKLAVLLGLVAGFLFLLPFGGRTLFDRWRASRDAGDFAARTWAEMRGVTPPPAPAGPRKGRPGKGQVATPGGAAGPTGATGPGDPSPADQPLETTTDADRKALDKLLDKHLADPPPKR
jgi:hypothetical protein